MQIRRRKIEIWSGERWTIWTEKHWSEECKTIWIEIWSWERKTEKYGELKNIGTLEYYKLEFYYGTRVLETWNAIFPHCFAKIITNEIVKNLRPTEEKKKTKKKKKPYRCLAWDSFKH